MKRRVVITGLGAITPIGNTVEEFWNGIKNGTVGIGPRNPRRKSRHRTDHKI